MPGVFSRDFSYLLQFWLGFRFSADSHKVRLLVWCKACRHRAEPDPAELARTYGAELAVPDWRSRLVCSRCGSRDIDMVVTGERR